MNGQHALHIAIDQEVCFCKPRVAGTRITVDLVVGLLRGGGSVDDVLADYPQLSADDIYACIAYDQRSERDL